MPPTVFHPLLRWRHRLRWASWAARVALAAACLAALPATAFDIQGHRGARGLAPENTLAGFRAALAAGATTWELDVGLTHDGQVVVMHDRRLNPDLTRNPAGDWIQPPTPTVVSLPLAVLQSYDIGRWRPGSPGAAAWPQQQASDGERVPTLDAVFALARREAPTRLRFNIETKLSPLAPHDTASPEAMVDALLEVIERHGLRQRVSVQSFDWRTLHRVHQRAPGLSTAALTAERPDFDTIRGGRWTAGLELARHGGSVPRLVRALGAPVWSPHFRDLNPERLAEARELGLRVIPWTVNTPADIDRLIGWGVDGLISDHPERVVASLAARRASLATKP